MFEYEESLTMRAPKHESFHEVVLSAFKENCSRPLCCIKSSFQNVIYGQLSDTIFHSNAGVTSYHDRTISPLLPTSFDPSASSAVQR